MNKAGLDESYLQCGSHYPLAEYVTEQMKKSNIKPEIVQCNCSAKHSGMLITGNYYGEDLNTYYQPEHPVQKRILKTLAEVCQYEEDKIILGTDGCGVPVHAMPLYKFAQGFARLSKPEVFDSTREKIVRQITNSMTNHPEMVAGTDRFCTDLMKVCGDRLFAKIGADGYYAIGLKDQGIGITVRIEDGDANVVASVALETLIQLNIITDEELYTLRKYHILNKLNHKNEIVGRTEIDFKLV